MRIGAPNIVKFLVALALLLALDGFWLGFLSRRLNVYPPFEKTRFGYGLLAWGALALAQSTVRVDTIQDGILFGCGVGGTSYLVFNGTELAIRPDWKLSTATMDVAWGTLMNAMTGGVLALIQ